MASGKGLRKEKILCIINKLFNKHFCSAMIFDCMG